MSVSRCVRARANSVDDFAEPPPRWLRSSIFVMT
jgi:hypothetical protein